MLKVNMFSSATKIKGQGVGSAYTELVGLLQRNFSDKLIVSYNKYSRTDISHYHTVDPQFYISTFFPGRGQKIGYVHFLPETLEGSLKLIQPFKAIFCHYVISFYRRMDHLVVVNPSFIPALAKYGISPEKITYIPNFVSKSDFHQVDQNQKNNLRQQLNIPLNKFVILGVGQIQERKGVFDFIKLAKKFPELQFIWVGGFSFGRITDGFDKLKEIVKNPPQNLQFPGIVERDRMGDYYNAADLFLLPSFNELFPMSILEAASCGLPILLRDLDLYQAIIKSNYLAGKNFAELAENIMALVKDRDLLVKYQAKAAKIAKEYSEERLANQWLNFYVQQSRLNKK
ncbi:glycosyltransferase family 4 protein [Liquorilactobacillus nagelii]|uniref:glycosyltransferase family 4 protein n=1 Tax=Liquorilactobacillus nagelii TaxID=82688 RepID=UPI001CCAA34A|nr:glycosyltransferase family 4 protein [Liquorilactobacillus nagelii]ULQ48622.1 glycosyltransferase family 4 protein [Liquorilactobacillus nagelii]